MFTLIAQGENAAQHWTESLSPGLTLTLGRADCDLCVPWDARISRQHATVVVHEHSLSIRRTSSATNPIFYSGSKVESCEVAPGDVFVIGQTTFQLHSRSESPGMGQQPVEQVTFDRRELTRYRYRDADKRIDVLANLPEVIRGTRLNSELYMRLTNLILAGVQNADAVAIVGQEDSGRMTVNHWERRKETAGDFKPSSRLVSEALGSKQTVLHIWPTSNEGTSDYTQIAECDWAFCTPISEAAGTPWGFYLAGRIDATVSASSEQATGVQLQGDVKFTEFVAEIISSVQRQTQLERQQAGLRQFFAPPILSALGDDLNTDLLEPRECDVTVLFCDLRGFSQTAEESADNLIGLLDRVSRALEVMTDQILRFGGVTGDFQGDAALGFWGWPFPSEDAPLNACRAALAIRQEFDRTRGQADHPLADFEMGIGIAHGRAVAGKIGTRDQVKVTVFGPVVNLASRLEGMTKQLRVPILVDETTAEFVRSQMVGEARLRRLARVLPVGMETPLMVSELMPTFAADTNLLSDEHVRNYERGVESFIAGDWESAWQFLHGIPAHDRAQDFLTMRITQSGRKAPGDWDGVVRLQVK